MTRLTDEQLAELERRYPHDEIHALLDAYRELRAKEERYRPLVEMMARGGFDTELARAALQGDDDGE